jgi:hypothetical protein
MGDRSSAVASLLKCVAGHGAGIASASGMPGLARGYASGASRMVRLETPGSLMRSCRKVFARALLVCAVSMSSLSAFAADSTWPTKPIRIVVPFAAGGGTDNIARALGQKLTETFGQQFVIDNRAGAGGTIGAEMVARANPDGYTLSMVSASYSANPALYKLPYDPVKGIAPINLSRS